MGVQLPTSLNWWVDAGFSTNHRRCTLIGTYPSRWGASTLDLGNHSQFHKGFNPPALLREPNGVFISPDHSPTYFWFGGDRFGGESRLIGHNCWNLLRTKKCDTVQTMFWKFITFPKTLLFEVWGVNSTPTYSPPPPQFNQTHKNIYISLYNYLNIKVWYLGCQVHALK